LALLLIVFLLFSKLDSYLYNFTPYDADQYAPFITTLLIKVLLTRGGSVVEWLSMLFIALWVSGSNPGVDTGEKGKKEQITFHLFSNCVVYP
jgi:hypothetical protein